MSGWDRLSRLDARRREAMEFLQDHLPASDLDSYPFELFLQFADHALWLRDSLARCGELEEEIFLHYVLFPRVNDEDLSFNRRLFFHHLWPRVRKLQSAEDVVLEVNRWCHEIASYEMTDERTASPLTVFRCGSGRCGEESAFLVSALRSVGVPARQVYVPRWSHCDDNHAWVEALCGETWRFLGACEPEPVLDRGWFNAPASRAVLVRSRLFGEGSSPLHGSPIGRVGIVRYYNQTSRYAPVSERIFRARLQGRPAVGVRFRLQILNEASFHTVAVLEGDASGTARAQLGPGTVHVLAELGNMRAEGECEGAEITLDLSPAADADSGWREFAFHAAPPAPGAAAPLGADERAKRREWLDEGDALRAERRASLCKADPGHPGWDDLLRSAMGNGGEILDFLSGPDSERRERLLRTLPAKDLRDTDSATLEDHFVNLPAATDGVPEEIFWAYTACPRIASEKLAPWRGAMRAWLSDLRGSPLEIWGRLERQIDDVASGLGPGLCWTPAGALAVGRCDRRSKYILFVAALRSMGVPARLRMADGAPEFWSRGGFQPLFPEEPGTLRLSAPPGESAGRSWSLSRWEGKGWRLLISGGEGCGLPWEAALPSGLYRLMTSVRLPSGDQLAARRDFVLRGQNMLDLPMKFREYRLEEALFCHALPPLSAVTPSGAQIPDIFRSNGRSSLLVWLEEGAEPTEHLLLELKARSEALNALPMNLILLPKAGGDAAQSALNDALSALNGAQLLYDDWEYDLEYVSRELTRDPDAPPLSVLCDGSGNAVYADSGYRTGSADLLLRAALCLTDGL